MSFLAEVQKTLHDVESTLSAEEAKLVHWAATGADDLWHTIERIAKVTTKDATTELDAAKKHLEDFVASLVKHLHL